MKDLISYLSELNTSDNSWGLYIDPNNIDNYRIGQVCFENGGLLDGYIFIDTLDNLSFGFQSTSEILKSLLEESNGIGEFTYKGKKSKCNVDAIITAFTEEKLDKDFFDFLLEGVNYTWYAWSTYGTTDFIEGVLPEILEARKLSVDS